MIKKNGLRGKCINNALERQGEGSEIQFREKATWNISVVVFTRSGGIIRCFSIRSDLYEYLAEKERQLL